MLMLSSHDLYDTRNVRHMKNMAGSMTRELKIMVTLSVRLYSVISFDCVLLVV